MYDDQTILQVSPIYIRIAAIASCILSAIGVTVAVYAYVWCVHPSTVHHFGRWGETTESIETYVFAYAVLQVPVALFMTYRWLRWPAEVQRLAAQEKDAKKRDPRIRQLRADAVLETICVLVVVFEAFLLSVVACRAVLIATQNL